MSNQRSQAAGDPLRPAKKKKRKRRWIGYTLLLMLGMALGVAAIAGNFVYNAYKELPPIKDFDVSLTSFVYDSKGQVVYKLAAEENRTLIKDIKEIPEQVLWSFVDTEDHRFYEHHGVDFYRVMGAVWNTAKYYMGVKGSQLEGASTITMQLAGNVFLDRSDLTPKRKIQEMLIATELEKKWTKDEILLRYLNQVSFGYQAAGLEEASHTYFNKSAKELTVAESAVLAGMLKGPSQYNPFQNKDGATSRRNIVLDLMVENGHLDAAKAAEIKQTEIKLTPALITPTTVTFTGDWYVDYVIEVLTNPTVSAKYGTPLFDEQDLFNKGLKIYTALDLDMQKMAQEKLQTMVPDAAINEY
ncbi:MAG TPA: transglycosylase domain-containing protein, partial [Symbiobacteriaceae bacterium]|nr:transglycosylase domain-containing protein [Symbiobacteriaceae bacterium]